MNSIVIVWLHLLVNKNECTSALAISQNFSEWRFAPFASYIHKYENLQELYYQK
jgi:hypothetical protein